MEAQKKNLENFWKILDQGYPPIPFEIKEKILLGLIDENDFIDENNRIDKNNRGDLIQIENDLIQIEIKKVSGEIISLNVSSSETILNIKKRIFGKISFDMSLQALIFAGQFLRNDKKLNDYRIQNTSRLFLVTLKKK